MSLATALVACGLAAAALVTDPQAQKAPAPLSLRFGVYTSDRATTLYKEFLPLLEYMDKPMEARLGRPVDIELRIFKTYEEGIDALVKGQVDFVRFGPSSYVIAKGQNPDIDVLAMETNGGSKDRPGWIVVRAQSAIRTIADLRGKSFAFADERSTIGRFFVQAILVRAGLREPDLGAMRYLGRHDKIVSAVELGDCDAGCVNANNAAEAVKSGTLRVLKEFSVPGKPLAARAGLDPVVKAALRATLLEVKDPAALRDLKITGFLAATDVDYQQVRDDMKTADLFAAPASRPATEPPPAPPHR